ncbi:molybdenum ABC transporter ATP-binding protein [Porticoccaceae bacterium LTM1]|nr:molybdenum ABC transporter ATP-binding protein [Porticoccaceae bacterium LTM1]
MSEGISKAMSIRASFKIVRESFSLDVDFEAPAKGVTAILGASGCGKTTLLRAIAGLEYDPDGYCLIGDLAWQQAKQSLPTHQRELGYVFQEASLFSHLSVEGNLKYGFRRIADQQRRVAFDEAVSLLGLEKLLSRRPDNLSGGERQRVAIARALLTSPRLLLMDEPLTGLDSRSKAEILPYLEKLHRKLEIPVLYVSHSQDEVARLADHLVLMEQGRVIASGPVAEMLARTDLPLAQQDDAETIIETTVSDLDDHYHLIHLQFAGGLFTVPGSGLSVGQPVRVRVMARDVSLSLQPPVDSSILNCLAAEVIDLTPVSAAQVVIRLNAGGVEMLARITRKSAEQLNIQPGSNLYALVKSIALLS